MKDEQVYYTKIAIIRKLVRSSGAIFKGICIKGKSKYLLHETLPNGLKIFFLTLYPPTLARVKASFLPAERFCIDGRLLNHCWFV